MKRLAFLLLAALLLSAPPAVTAEGRTAAVEEAPAPPVEAYDPAWDIPATEYAYCTDVFLGEFVLTAYCPCARCCGKSDGITASGTLALEGRTVAVDPRIIPYGTRLLLIWPDGTQHAYTAEDCGSGVTANHIDIFFADHETARVFGVQSAMVYLTKEEYP